MSLSCISWGAGREVRRRTFRGTPFDDRVNREKHIWLLVGPRVKVRQTIRLAGCHWKLVSSKDLQTRDKDGALRVTLRKLVYERASDPPKCNAFS